jgi:hypothetical protein
MVKDRSNTKRIVEQRVWCSLYSSFKAYSLDKSTSKADTQLTTFHARASPFHRYVLMGRAAFASACVVNAYKGAQDDII